MPHITTYICIYIYGYTQANTKSLSPPLKLIVFIRLPLAPIVEIPGSVSHNVASGKVDAVPMVSLCAMLQSLVVKPRNLGFRGFGARLTQVKDLGCIGAQVGHLGFLPIALGICQALPARGRGRIGHTFAGQEVLHSISCMLKVLRFEGDKASAGRFP